MTNVTSTTSAPVPEYASPQTFQPFPLPKPPLWWRAVSSFWLHFAIVLAICYGYNWAIDHYNLELARKGGFDPAIAPLYARASNFDPADHVRNLRQVLPP